MCLQAWAQSLASVSIMGKVFPRCLLSLHPGPQNEAHMEQDQSLSHSNKQTQPVLQFEDKLPSQAQTTHRYMRNKCLLLNATRLCGCLSCNIIITMVTNILSLGKVVIVILTSFFLFFLLIRYISIYYFYNQKKKLYPL